MAMAKCFLFIGEDGLTIYRVSDGVCIEISETDVEYPNFKQQLDDAIAQEKARLRGSDEPTIGHHHHIMYGVPCK